jgi:hypothetical protein
MHRIYPEHALSLKLLMLSSGEERSVSLPPSWEEMERDLIEAARQGEEGPFGGIPEKCPSCPWRQGLCGGA